MLSLTRNQIVQFFLHCQPGQSVLFQWEVDALATVYPAFHRREYAHLQVGDSAFGWAGDHVEPGVSCTADTLKPFEHPNNSLQIFACVGNKARLVTGEAKGEEGVVLGHHGGSEHVIVDFPRPVKEKLTYEDKIVIFAKGQGLAAERYTEFALFKLDPGCC